MITKHYGKNSIKNAIQEMKLILKVNLKVEKPM